MINLEEAKKVIAEYLNKDAYILANIKRWWGENGADDNSCQLSEYWDSCEETIKYSKKKVDGRKYNGNHHNFAGKKNHNQ